MQTPEKFYEPIVGRCSSALNNLNSQLKWISAKGKVGSEVQTLNFGLTALYDPKNTGEDQQRDNFGSLLFNLRKVLAEVQETFGNDLAWLEREERNQELKRRNERAAEWTRYWHKTGRWIVSAIFTVGLYSAFVNLSKTELLQGALHIPIHDWLMQQDESDLRHQAASIEEKTSGIEASRAAAAQ